MNLPSSHKSFERWGKTKADLDGITPKKSAQGKER